MAGRWRALAGPALLVAALLLGAHLLAGRREAWQALLAGLGGWAPVLYLLLWLVLVPAGLPAAALGLAAGALFGAGPGTGWAALGLLMSGALMHALGSRWLRPRANRLAAGSPRLQRLQRASAGGGIRMHLLARLSPLNYALVSYTLAAGGARARPYLAGLAGGLPGLAAYVWMGAATRNGAGAGAATGGSGVRLALTVAGAIGLAGLAWWLARVARRQPDGD